MRTELRSHLTFANVASAVALFMALSTGGAYAVNEWTGANIQDGTLTGADVKNESLSGADVALNSLGTGRIADNSLTGADVADNSLTDADVRADTLTGADIGADAVGTSEVATGAVRTEELANGQVQAEDLAPGVAPGASGARAWGLVHASGNLLRSKNVTGVTPLGSGVYCIDPGSGIDPDTAVLMAGETSPGNNTDDTLDNVAHVEWDSNPSSTPSPCPAGTMKVRTFVGNGEPPSGGGFDLFPNNARFTFVIP